MAATVREGSIAGKIAKLANRLYVEACERVGKKLALRIPETTMERDYFVFAFQPLSARHLRKR